MRSIRALMIAALGLAMFAGVPARAAGCTAEAHAGGEWPSYGGDLANTRNQASESTIDASNVASMVPAWTFSFAGESADGNIQAPPVTGGGCLFVASDTGWVVGLDADSGDLAWKTQYPVGGQVAGIFGLAVADGRVYGASVDQAGPFAFALDAATGIEEWRSEPFPEIGTTINSSTVLYDGVLLIAGWGDDPDPTAHSGYALVDAATGGILELVHVIPEDHWDEGYAGGGIWGTTAIDPEHGFGYVGTANPYSKRNEHDHTNAIVKIDLNRGSESFGQIVGFYKGTYDNYVPGAYDNPVCQTAPEIPEGSYNLSCLQLDIDFGASPSVWADGEGRPIVGALQKAGIFHAAYADTMEEAWTNVLSAPLLLGNASTATVIDDQVVVSANPGLVWSMDDTSGSASWIAPTLDGVRYQAMASANGVVYTVDGNGNLHAIDAATGMPLLQRSVSTDAGTTASILSSPSVSIARNKVYAPAGGGLAAYGLPA